MKTYSPPSTKISLDDSWDVIVIGGGPAGCASAAAAGLEGARTLLLEATGSLGGMGTSALVPAWTPFSDKEKIIYCGLAEKVFNECKAGMPHVKKTDLDWVPIDPERLKRVYDKLVTDAGVKVLFNTHLAQVEAKDGEVQAITVVNKSGMTAYKARDFIDCSGDADLAAWAGAEFHQGNEKGERLMPATHCFVLTNVDEYAYLNGPNLHGANPNSPIHAIVASGKYPEIPDVHLCSNIIGPGTVGFNAGHIWKVDNTKPETVSAALIEGRKMADAFQRALAEYHPKAFGNAYLVQTGSLMGIRETRRIVGDYILTLEDFLQRRTFADEICRNAYFIDVHWAKEEIANDIDTMRKWEKTTFHYNPGESHGIPYRCLTPKKLKNVLVAGRSISCEQIVQGSVRVMPVCLAMGHAAGIAAVLAAKKDANVHQVSIPDLRQKLLKAGAYLPEPAVAKTEALEPAIA
jgi:glycine/D-amino acid oxidase-like deaminating enzyme